MNNPMAKATTGKEAAGLKTLADFPDLAAAEARLAELRDDLDARQRRLTTYLDRKSRKASEPDPALTEAAERLLAGGGLYIDEPPYDAEKEAREMAVVRIALAKQERLVVDEKVKAERGVRESFLIPHKAAARAIGTALADLWTALYEERLLRDELARRDVRFSAPLVPAVFIDGDTATSILENWFKEVASYAGVKPPDFTRALRG
jgi:hypothetical protein